MSTNGYSALKGERLLLEYLVREPRIKTEHPPMVILLHGVGGNETNLFPYAALFPDEYYVIAPRAPFVLGRDSYAWFRVSFTVDGPVIDAEQAEKSRTVLKQFVNQLTELFAVDPNRLYMAGFSQGGIMSASVGLTSPGKLAGIGILSGRILSEIKLIAVASPLRIYVAHGVHDQVLPVRHARETKEYLLSLGLKPEYREMDLYHEVDIDEMRDLIRWMA